MKYSRFLSILILVFSLAASTICCKPKHQPKTKEQVMEERLTERLQRWRNDYEADCRKRIIDRATAIVDSTLIANARLNRDTAGAPFVPPRPEKPAYIPPPDTTPIAPLLQPNGRDTNRQQ